MTALDKAYVKALRAAFKMPGNQKIIARKTSITNSFVNSVIPRVRPTPEQIEQALTILAMTADDVRCSYCGNKSTEWDHLRALVNNRRPTGYITEIANLVPACNKCNQSKGNSHWQQWMASAAPHSPSTRSTVDVNDRIRRLEAYVNYFPPTRVNFEEVLPSDEWERYWQLCDEIVSDMTEAQAVADDILGRVRVSMK